MKKKKPLVIGVTGSIGMGKTTASKMFARLGLPVFDADKTVHDLLGPEGKAVKKIASLFPSTVKGNAISRKKLGEVIFDNPRNITTIESVLHPLVWKERENFLKQAAQRGDLGVILEIPLLFETGAEKNCDVTICISAKTAVQKERVLKRRHMTTAKMKAILSRQLSDAEKRRRADFVIRSDVDIKDMFLEVKKTWQKILLKEDTYRA